MEGLIPACNASKEFVGGKADVGGMVRGRGFVDPGEMGIGSPRMSVVWGLYSTSNHPKNVSLRE